MVNQKDKGKRWEKEATKKLNELVTNTNWKRIPSSGAMGTILKEPLLASDIQGMIPYLSKKILMEAKVGYGGSKYMTIRKEWFDKVQEEAETAMGIPMLICKFDNVRSGVARFVAMDLTIFAEVMNEVNELHEELQGVYEKLAELEE